MSATNGAYTAYRYVVTINNEQRYTPPNPHNYDYVNERPLGIPANYLWTTRIIDMDVAANSAEEAESYVRESIAEILDPAKASIGNVQLTNTYEVAY